MCNELYGIETLVLLCFALKEYVWMFKKLDRADSCSSGLNIYGGSNLNYNPK